MLVEKKHNVLSVWTQGFLAFGGVDGQKGIAVNDAMARDETRLALLCDELERSQGGRLEWRGCASRRGRRRGRVGGWAWSAEVGGCRAGGGGEMNGLVDWGPGC
jgi:hypothetical protein